MIETNQKSDQGSQQLELHVYSSDKFNSIEFQDIESIRFDKNKLSKLVHLLVDLDP